MSRHSEALESAKKFLEAQSHLQEIAATSPQPTTQPSASPPAEISKDDLELICLLGKPGSGKTYTALTVLDIPGVDKAIAIDADKKIANMSAAREYIKQGRLEILTVKSPLISGSMERRAGKSQAIKSRRGGDDFITIAAPDTEPKGYLEIMRIMDELDERIVRFGAQAVITDSLTRCYEHMHRLISFMTKRGTLEESAWNIALMNGEEFIHAHMALRVKYAIITAHTRMIYDEKTGVWIATEPEVQGSMRSKLLGYFNEAYYMDPTAAGVYRMCTRLTAFTPARTAKVLNSYEPPTLRVVYDPAFREEWYRNNKPM